MIPWTTFSLLRDALQLALFGLTWNGALFLLLGLVCLGFWLILLWHLERKREKAA